MKRIVLLIAGIVLFIEGTWIIAIPMSLVQSILEHPGNNLYLKAEGLKKGLFFSFDIEKILLKKKGLEDPLVVLNDMHGSINLISLLKLSPEIDIECLLNGGEILGEIKLEDRYGLKIKGDSVSINGIPLLELMGIYGRGSLTGNFWLKNKRGGIRFSINDMKLKSTTFPPRDMERLGEIGLSKGVPLPLDLFESMKGEVTINNETLEVKSFTMEGPGVYARVKGDIREGKVDMKLEVMTDSSFKSEPLISLMLGQYRVSPGYYLIPLRT